MKVELAPYYRNWMLALLPTTFGLGTAALWLISLEWPASIDELGLVLRDKRRVDWTSIRKIRVSRSYLDDHVSHIRIHYDGGVAGIRVDRLEHGQDVVRIVLAMFEHVNQVRKAQRSGQEIPTPDRGAGGVGRTRPTGRRATTAGSASSRDDTWTQELAMLGKTLGSYPEKIQDSARFAREGI